MEQTGSREAIKQSALDQLVRHGYRGMNFGAIARDLAITRANIHYHFGSKAALIDELLADYVATTLEALATIWGDSATSLTDKIEAMIAYSRARYRRFNPTGGPIRPWSLISRLRQDEELLSDRGRAQIRGFTKEMDEIICTALDRARLVQEIPPGTSSRALSQVLLLIADNAAPITLAGGGFACLEDSYHALLELSGIARKPAE